jgi:acyl-CoA thioesterase
MTAYASDQSIAFASLGATGHGRGGAPNDHWELAPAVSPPLTGEAWSSPYEMMADLIPGFSISASEPDQGFSAAIEVRRAVPIDRNAPGPLCVWARRRDGQPMTPATAALVADFVPTSILSALSVPARLVSLDNTIRIGAIRASEWLLLSFRPHVTANDYGHGSVFLWTPDGHLVAVGSQTASIRQAEQ